MAIKKFKTKDLRDAVEVSNKELKKEKYFFPDIDGRQVTVEAASREEAEKKAKGLINNK